MVWSSATRKEFIQFNIDLLETFFGPDWFRSNAQRKLNHPAFQRWLLSQQILRTGGRLPTLEPSFLLRFLPSFGRLILDGAILSSTSGGEVTKFTLGSFANYGDDTVRKRIDSIKDSPIHFASLLSELSYAAWHQMKGHTVTAYDDESLPDFKVAIPGLHLPTIADCKHIGPTTSPVRIKKLIQKTNSQVKKLGEDGYGLAIIDLTDSALIIRTEPSDNMPPPVEQAVATAQSAMQHSNSSVNGAIIIWDESTILGLGKPEGAYLALRRRSVFVRHKQPKHSIQADPALLQPSFNLSFVVRSQQN